MKRQDSQQPAIRSRARLQTPSVRGASGDPVRGSYCTPKYVADALPAFDLDAFSNPRSHIRARVSLALERGEDGFGNGEPGTHWTHAQSGCSLRSVRHLEGSDPRAPHLRQARANDRTWLQPDYTQVLACVRHYLHTRFVALLRFDPRPEWADLVGGASEWIGVLSNSPGRSSFEFEPAPGVVASSNTFPHALYARHYADVTPSMRALCSYPDGTARHFRKRSAISPDWLTRWGLDPALFALETAPTLDTKAT